MLCEIQTFGFFFFGNAQTHDPVDYFQDDGADDAGIDHGCGDASELYGDLTADTGDITAKTSATQTWSAEHTG